GVRRRRGRCGAPRRDAAPASGRARERLSVVAADGRPDGAAMNTSMKPWGLLSAGDRFAVRSHSGNRYELVFVCAGEGESGLFARFSTGKLARFYPEKLDWTTLERLGESPFVVPGDEILVTLADRELRGRIASTRPESLLVLMANGQAISVTLDGTIRKSLRLL